MTLGFRNFVAVKKVIAIFLLLQIITNNAFAEEFVKMPTLFTHFYHHAKEHKDVNNFFEFLHKHYSDHHKNDSHLKSHDHEDEDCKLPFKHCGNCCVSIHVPVTGCISNSLTADCTFFQTEASDFIPEDERIESLDLCSIWQPPKLA